MTDREMVGMDPERLAPYLERYSEANEDFSVRILFGTERIWNETYFELWVVDNVSGRLLAYSHSPEPDRFTEDEFYDDFIRPRRVWRPPAT